MNKHNTIGIDLAKNTFYLVKLNQLGEQIERKKFNRKQLPQYLARQELCVVAMEACATSHYWGRKIEALGFEVCLLPAQHVKGYLRGQKNDYNDAKAIAEACQHGAIRTVPIKTLDQQDEQTFLQMRQHVIDERKDLINHIRGLLAEYGEVLPKGPENLRKALPLIIEDAENELTFSFRTLLQRQYARLIDLNEELAWYEEQMVLKVRDKEICQKLMKIPGIGVVVSLSLATWLGNGQQFKRARDASAALGLIPKQFSTGGRDKLSGITKRGNKQLRSLMIAGAINVINRAKDKKDKLSIWINQLHQSKGLKKTAVALANKIARIAWAVVYRNEHYAPIK